jgi:hypothetical protein
MKKMFFMLLVLGISAGKAAAQSDEVVQLVLNVEKLAQFKQILSDMKKGYEVLNSGYNTVRDLSQGNFTIHKAFMDGLMTASPTVKKYYKVAKIIEYQVALVKEYRQAYDRFRNSNLLNATELKYLATVYSNLMGHSLRNLEELANVVTSGKLQMSDDERLRAIDGIYDEMEDKLSFLRSFNSNTSLLTLQRKKEKLETERTKSLYNLN